MENKSGTGGLNVGGSSILVIFVLLCLTTFATLTMVSASADYRLTQRAVQASENYYAADNRAEEIFAQVGEVARGSKSVPAPWDYINDALGGIGQDITYATNSQNGGVVSYNVPIDDTQAIAVQLIVEYSSGSCVVNQWKVVSTAPLIDFDEESFILLDPSTFDLMMIPD